MKRPFILGAIVIVASMGPWGCSDTGNFRELTATEQSLAASFNRFGLSLFAELVREKPGENVIVSPLSVSFALGMTQNGAAGEARAAMVDTLGFEGMAPEDVNLGYHGLMEVLGSTDSAVEMRLANGIWVDDGFLLRQEFVGICKKYFGAPARAMDFKNNPEAVKSAIDSWAREQTNGRIDDVVEPPGDSIVMYLVNAIYFFGTWALQFDPAETRPDVFHGGDGQDVQLRMMNLKGNLPYNNSADFDAVSLPYGNGYFNMTLILPAPGTELGRLVDNLENGGWEATVAGLKSREGTVELPRFTLDWKSRLNDSLQNLGMKPAFSGDADFSNMVENPEGIQIGFVDHAAFMRVDEKGTEAAAVTTVGMMGVDVAVSNAFVFRVDRPFLLAIHDLHSGALLFLGRIETLPPEP